MLSSLLFSALFFPSLIVYLSFLFCMTFLGEEALLAVGALSRLGYINFWWALIFCALGAMAGDFLWYQVGKARGEKWVAKYGHYFCITPERFQKIERRIKKNGVAFIMVSKFIYGLNHLSLAAAGAVNFNFRKFLKAQIATTASWVFIFLSLGYVFAHSLAAIKHDVKLILVGLLGFFLFIVLLEEVVGRLLKMFNSNGK